MGEPALYAAIGGGAAAGIGQVISGMTSSDGTHRSWYELRCLYNIFQFPDEYTDLIDMMLARDPKAIVHDWIMKSSNLRVPGLGAHLYYWSGCGNHLYWHYVTFEKKLTQNTQTYYYVCHASIGQTITFGEAIQKIFRTETGKVRTISIDTSRQAGPFPLFVDKICSGTAAPHQQVAIDHILQSWSTDVVNRNCKVFLSGERGSGKSYIARIIKQQIEAHPQFRECLVRLYDDFNPSAPGCSIKLLILQNARPYTPVILVIDEGDICFALAQEGNRADKHAVMVHTKDKKTFNDMMDAIGDTQNIIAIFTTEKTPEALYANPAWHSFMRKGRIDYFLQYVPIVAPPTGAPGVAAPFRANAAKQFQCLKLEHHQIPGWIS